MSSKHTHNLGSALDPAKYVSTPSIVGQGWWGCIHTLGYHAVTQEQQDAAAKNIEVLIFNFPCLECRQDAIASWRRDPATAHTKEDRELFKWTVKEHNRVNNKFSPPKPNYTVEQAYEIWSGTNFCAHGCDTAPRAPVPTKTPVRVTVVSPPRQRPQDIAPSRAYP